LRSFKKWAVKLRINLKSKLIKGAYYIVIYSDIKKGDHFNRKNELVIAAASSYILFDNYIKIKIESY